MPNFLKVCFFAEKKIVPGYKILTKIHTNIRNLKQKLNKLINSMVFIKKFLFYLVVVICIQITVALFTATSSYPCARIKVNFIHIWFKFEKNLSAFCLQEGLTRCMGFCSGVLSVGSGCRFMKS